jgi:D-3-phosphoglycerate dehydrogenase
MRVLILENIHSIATSMFQDAGHEVIVLPSALDEDQLLDALNGNQIDILCIRSKTGVTRKVLSQAKMLKWVGCYCVGTDQVDLRAAQEMDVKIINAPLASTRSVAEMTLASIIMLFRQLGDRNNELHQGRWNKVSGGCFEVRGKSLGIVGFGNIGTQVSILAEAFGMTVRYYDIVPKLALGTATRVSSLDDLLTSSDVVTLHVPDTELTRGMINTSTLSRMRDGSYLINHARGSLVDIEALLRALHDNLAGAAIDVYPEEPSSNGKFVSPLMGISNVILTPHIGGSTSEAQRAIGVEVTSKILGL